MKRIPPSAKMEQALTERLQAGFTGHPACQVVTWVDRLIRETEADSRQDKRAGEAGQRGLLEMLRWRSFGECRMLSSEVTWGRSHDIWTRARNVVMPGGVNFHGQKPIALRVSLSLPPRSLLAPLSSHKSDTPRSQLRRAGIRCA